MFSSYFRAFSLELEEHCNKDYVEVRHGGPGGPVLGRFCGGAIPPVVTEYHFLWVKFKSDEDTPGVGFRATYKISELASR